MRRSFGLAVIILSAVSGMARGELFTLGAEKVVPEPRPRLPIYRFCPDGHLTWLPEESGAQAYFVGSTSYRAVGKSLFALASAQPVLRGGGKGSFDNGGAWLNGVFRKHGTALVGFYHAEDQQFDGDPSSRDVAWKSIAGCTSDDNGVTWRKNGQIITSATAKPRQPTWGGCGDFCVIRDTKNERWLCFYQEHFLSLASSADPDGLPGTWKKLLRGNFTEPGLGGESSPIEGLQGHAGGNPSVHFNTYLNKWVMVWGTWGEGSPAPDSIWLSTSDDLVNWEAPQVVVEAKGQQRNWYPTIVGETDQTAGQKALLCYANFPDKSQSARRFVVREITFQLP